MKSQRKADRPLSLRACLALLAPGPHLARDGGTPRGRGGKLGQPAHRVERLRTNGVCHRLRLHGGGDYGTARAMTTMGIIGIKVWINKGEIMDHDPYAHERRLTETGDTRSRGQDRPGGGRPQQRDRRPARAN